MPDQRFASQPNHQQSTSFTSALQLPLLALLEPGMARFGQSVLLEAATRPVWWSSRALA
jgi:hypothetical protein